MPKAMNLTFGDFIIIEIALVHYLKDLDLSMQSGQYMSELLGKVEYTLTEIRELASKQAPPGLETQDPALNPNK